MTPAQKATVLTHLRNLVTHDERENEDADLPAFRAAIRYLEAPCDANLGEIERRLLIAEANAEEAGDALDDGDEDALRDVLLDPREVCPDIRALLAMVRAGGWDKAAIAALQGSLKAAEAKLAEVTRERDDLSATKIGETVKGLTSAIEHRGNMIAGHERTIAALNEMSAEQRAYLVGHSEHQASAPRTMSRSRMNDALDAHAKLAAALKLLEAP